jgi:hypothetical protein
MIVIVARGDNLAVAHSGHRNVRHPKRVACRRYQRLGHQTMTEGADISIPTADVRQAIDARTKSRADAESFSR